MNDPALPSDCEGGSPALLWPYAISAEKAEKTGNLRGGHQPDALVKHHPPTSLAECGSNPAVTFRGT
jgi:hypothetical protein